MGNIDLLKDALKYGYSAFIGMELRSNILSFPFQLPLFALVSCQWLPSSLRPLMRIAVMIWGSLWGRLVRLVVRWCRVLTG